MASKKNVIFAEPLAVGSGNTTGLLPGDRLVSVNGVNVESASREDIIELIRLWWWWWCCCCGLVVVGEALIDVLKI